MKKIACVGDNCIDYYAQSGQAFPGGNPVNVAVYTCRLGGGASYIGAVGTDAYGDLLLRALQDKGVDISRVQRLAGNTALTQVRVENGERILGDYDEGVMADFALRPADVDFLCAHDLVVSGLWGKVENELSQVAARGVPVAFDCADRPEDPAAQTALRSADIAFFSDDNQDEAALRARMRAVAALGPRVVVATRGAMGSLAFDGERYMPFGIISCPVVDTMGAGDSYIAGFLHAYLEKRSLFACMEAGARASAFTIGYAGAW